MKPVKTLLAVLALSACAIDAAPREARKPIFAEIRRMKILLVRVEKAARRSEEKTP